MLDDGGEGDGEGLGEARDREGSGAEFLEDGAAGGIAQGVKDAVDVGFAAAHAGVSGRVRRSNVEQFVPAGFAHLRAVGAFEDAP